MTHASLALSAGKKVFTVVVAIAMALTWMSQAQADGTAANKLAVAGSKLVSTSANSAPVLVLDETMKVSSVRDLILQLTTECSIVTALSNDDDGENQTSRGKVELWIHIDGKSVPVAEGDTTDGRVVFCDREYSRTITDQDGDGEIDKVDDYIATRTANAFNWVAFDAGTVYDDPANGNNIIDIEVFAQYTKTPAECSATPLGSTCGDALIGNRTLVVENTNAQNEEVSTQTDPSPAPGDPGCGLPICP